MENSIEELKQRLEELYQTQQARLDVGADDLDIREEIAEAEDEIKELQADINEKNNNGSDTDVGSIENSIEEAKRIIEKLISTMKSDREMFDEKTTEKEIYTFFINALEFILSDYKRVLKINEVLLKENEELKQDRNNNYQMIALAQNEALGYMQGYEDGKKLKRSAVANIVENQQYYIIKKQIEKYETYIEQLRKELGQKDKIIDLMAETINNYDIDEDVCKQMGQKANCNEYEDAKECKECIKQYFINKAKEIK